MSKKTKEINQKYLNFGAILSNSASIRLNENVVNEEKEIDRFFNYCMARLIWEIYCSSEPRESYYLKLEQCTSSKDCVVLKHGQISNYVSFSVTANKFYSVIEKVCDMFNDESMKHYRSICDTTPGHASIIIFLENFSE